MSMRKPLKAEELAAHGPYSALKMEISRANRTATLVLIDARGVEHFTPLPWSKEYECSDETKDYFFSRILEGCVQAAKIRRMISDRSPCTIIDLDESQQFSN